MPMKPIPVPSGAPSIELTLAPSVGTPAPMKRRLALAAITAGSTALLATLAGCGTQQISDYANERPVLDLRRYFNGTLDAYGVFTDRSGKVVKRFTVVMNCTWQGDNGVLDEDFLYSDGTKQKRIWRLTAATPAAPMTWWASPWASRAAMRFAGLTP